MEYTLAAVNLKSVDMFARLYDGRYGRLPGGAGGMANIDGTGHTSLNKAKEALDPTEIQGDTESDEDRYLMPTNNIRITFSIDDKSGRISIRVIDALTNEVIRYVPPEELVSVMSWLCEFQDILAGLV
ncbi:MAG: flagellar protein FlaG, partial [Firmicutes bacterium]|nr:flagellar protein FlaG [Bacillota bacterium]